MPPALDEVRPDRYLPDNDFFLWVLFDKLRRQYRFPLRPDDYVTLQNALRAGFGWSSPQALCDLCCALWASSRQEQEVITVIFGAESLLVPPLSLPDDLETPAELPPPDLPPPPTPSENSASANMDGKIESSPPLVEKKASSFAGLAPMPQPLNLSRRAFLFDPQFPLTRREIVQAWRRLRQPTREGAATELDIEATVRVRCYSGIATPPVLVPPRRNRARLLLLEDRGGSMTPFHFFSDYFAQAIREAARLDRFSHYYFHNALIEGADTDLLRKAGNAIFPQLDKVIGEIKPLAEGFFFTDPQRLNLQEVKVALEAARGAGVVILSDAGAAQQHTDVVRVLDTLAFIKAVQGYTRRIVWLNPLPRAHWERTTAERIARHLPMFPMDREGLEQAVNVLRGQPIPLECPL